MKNWMLILLFACSCTVENTKSSSEIPSWAVGTWSTIDSEKLENIRTFKIDENHFSISKGLDGGRNKMNDPKIQTQVSSLKNEFKISTIQSNDTTHYEFKRSDLVEEKEVLLWRITFKENVEGDFSNQKGKLLFNIE